MATALTGAVQVERGSRADTFLHAPTATHPSRRRTLIAIAVALALIAGVATTVSELDASGAYAAAAYPSETLQLTFPTTAPIETILVQSGQHVREGQVLALQATPALSAAVSLARAAVAADTERVAALKQLLASMPDGAKSSSVSETDADLAEIQAGDQLVAASSEEATALAAAENALASARQSLASATAAESASCPGGKPASSATSPARCAALAAAVARAEAQVATETSATIAAPARAAQLRASGERAIAAGEASLAAEAESKATLTSTTVEAELTAAEASLAVARSQLATDLQQAANSVLRAPSAGTVEQVSGAPGDLAGPGGVRATGSTPPAEGTDSFQLFPAAGSASANTPTASSAPVVTLRVGTAWQVLARVPESAVTSIHRGEEGTFTFDPLGGAVLHCTVAGISALASDGGGGQVSYEVVLRVLGRPPASALPGMSGSVTFG